MLDPFESGETNRHHIPPAPLPKGGGGNDFKIKLKKEKKRSKEKEGKGKTKRQSDKKRAGMVGKTRDIESKKGDFAVMILEAFSNLALEGFQNRCYIIQLCIMNKNPSPRSPTTRRRPSRNITV